MSEPKRCSHCTDSYPAEDFYITRANKDGLDGWCKYCRRASKKTPEARAKAAALARTPEYRQKNKEWIRKNEAHYKRNQYDTRIRREYGISAEDVDAMRSAQDNRCALCSRPFSSHPHIDHDHTSGAVRALLCNKCNRGLGYFDDSPSLLSKALEYLAKHKTLLKVA